MSGHTPGSWRAESEWPVVHATGTLNIADCHKARRFRMSEYISRDEQAANARLIASSPDLLEATKAHLEQCTEDTWQGLIDAVSKAEGK